MQFDQLERRKFITLLGGAAAAWPLAARAQQPAMPVIGFLNGTTPVEWAPFVTAWRRGLSESGFVEGRNVDIVYEWAENHPDRLPTMADGLVRRRVSVIVASGGGAAVARAAKEATKTIPIVFVVAGDPVRLGLVAALNRPGGNVTGINLLLSESGGKRLELLRELLPKATTVGWLFNPDSPPAAAEVGDVEAMAANPTTCFDTRGPQRARCRQCVCDPGRATCRCCYRNPRCICSGAASSVSGDRALCGL
jgi:putative ABC transport system substrate-binding protein